MERRSNQAQSKRPFWHRLVGVVAIYALVMQPLLLTMLGSQLVQAAALDQVNYGQLCEHNADGSPVTPSDQQQAPAHQHCLQCFSGAFHLFDTPQVVTVVTADQRFRTVRHQHRALKLVASNYSAASPRGPPLSA